MMVMILPNKLGYVNSALVIVRLAMNALAWQQVEKKKKRDKAAGKNEKIHYR